MKKVLLSLLAVILLLGGLAGAVYAVGDHQPAKDQKLVGVSNLGTKTFPWGSIELKPVFRFTNPDCVEEIAITKVSIIRANETVIYEGPYIGVTGPSNNPVRTVIAEPMSPHEVRIIVLFDYMWTGLGVDYTNLTANDNWLTVGEALAQEAAQYTVEIEWEAEGAVNPLTGWQRTNRKEVRPDGTYRMLAESQMVNLKQRLSH